MVSKTICSVGSMDGYDDIYPGKPIVLRSVRQVGHRGHTIGPST